MFTSRVGKWAAGGAACVGSLCGAVALAEPASAAGGCVSGNVCIWADTQFVTQGDQNKRYSVVNFDRTLAGNVYAGTGISANASASSVSNVGMTVAHLYTGANCTGMEFNLPPGMGDANLSDTAGIVPAGFNNQIRALVFHVFDPRCGF